MKAAIASVVALLVGLGAGFWFGMGRVNALQDELEKVRGDGSDLQGRVQALQSDLAERETELGRLRQEFELARSQPSVEAPTDAMELELDDFDSAELFAQLAQALDEADESGRQQGRFGDRSGDRSGERFRGTRRPPEEGREQREDRRRSYADDYRTRMNDFFSNEIEASTDPDEKARLASISEYSQSLMEQRQLLRDAQSDEERQAIFETMRQNGDTLRSMVEEQQDQVLRDALARQGVSGRAQQDGIIGAYKEAQRGPFFSGPFTFFGGGGRGRGGGRPLMASPGGRSR